MFTFLLETWSTEGECIYTLWLLAYHICARLPCQQRVMSKGHDDSRTVDHRPRQHQSEKVEKAELELAVPLPLWSLSLFFLDAFCDCLGSTVTGLLDALVLIAGAEELFPPHLCEA